MTVLAEQVSRNIAPLFHGDAPVYVSDEEEHVDYLKDVGLPAVSFAAFATLDTEAKECAVVLGASNEKAPRKDYWDHHFGSSRLFIIPMMAFQHDLAALQYTLEVLARTDFVDAARRNDEWMKHILYGYGRYHFSAPACDFDLEMSEDIHVMRPRTDVEIEDGFWEAIGACLEVGMVSRTVENTPSFTVTGEFHPDGVAVAHHRAYYREAMPSAEAAWKLLTRDRVSDLTVSVDNSSVTSVTCAGREIKDDLAALTDPGHMLLSEMGFGTNAGVTESNVDWRINSQLNEGSLGLHIGIGAGVHAAHIDFVCTDVSPPPNIEGV